MKRTFEPIPFGKYELLERLAVGGMAEVFRARVRGEGGFEKHLIIKRILPHLSSDSEFVMMLIDEAKIAVCLSHPNIVQVYDLGKTEGTYFIAMEFIEGGDLREILRRCAARNITVPIHHAIYITTEVLKGLDYAHSKRAGGGGASVPLQIIHRDISPPNILLSYAGEVKIVDFGIAKASTRMMETAAGILKGKFEYMSPEQASGLAVDARSDLFSTALLLYEMLVGKNPFVAEADLQVLNHVRNARVVPPSRLNPAIPPRLEQIVMKALQLDADKRYLKAGEMGADLLSFAYQSGHVSNASKLSRFMARLFAEEIAMGRTASSASPQSQTGGWSKTEPISSLARQTRTPPPTREAGTPAAPGSFDDDFDDEGVTEAINLAELMGKSAPRGAVSSPVPLQRETPDHKNAPERQPGESGKAPSLPRGILAVDGKKAFSFFDSPGASPDFDATFVPPPIEDDDDDDDDVVTTIQTLPLPEAGSGRRPKPVQNIAPAQARPAGPEPGPDALPRDQGAGPAGAAPDDQVMDDALEARPTTPIHVPSGKGRRARGTAEKRPRIEPPRVSREQGAPPVATGRETAGGEGEARNVLPPRLSSDRVSLPGTSALTGEQGAAAASAGPSGAVADRGTGAPSDRATQGEGAGMRSKPSPVLLAFVAGVISGVLLTVLVFAMMFGGGRSPEMGRNRDHVLDLPTYHRSSQTSRIEHGQATL